MRSGFLQPVSNSLAAAAVLLNYFSLIGDFSAMKQWASASFKLLWQ